MKIKNLKTYLEAYPWAYIQFGIIFNKLKKRQTSRFVTVKTDITIEGFPRSSNSYLSRLVRHLNPKLQIATHLHSNANVVQSLKWNIPTVVLIRNPKDAIVSLAALTHEIDTRKNNPLRKIDFDKSIRDYIRFYKPLLKSKDKFITAHFNEVVTNPVAIIKEINTKTNLSLSEKADMNDFERVLDSGKEFHILPNKTRESLKSNIKKEFSNYINSNDFLEAVALYKAFIS